MKKMLPFLILFLLSAFITSGVAQTPPGMNVRIKGEVLDSLTKESIPYATVKIIDKNNPGAVLKTVVAKENGKFDLTFNGTGEFLLVTQFTGKKESSQPITLESEKSIDVGEILLSDDNVLEEVVVTAFKPLVKVDLDKIDYSMEDDPEAKTNNILEMLKKVPMVTVDAEENIQLKGSSSFKIYLNGKPSNLITNNPKDVLKSMPASSVKNIEVITDPGAKYDAEGVTGIINIVMHKNSSMGGYTATVNARVDNYGGYGMGAFLSLKYGKLGFTGNYNYSEYKSPKVESYSQREDLTGAPGKYLTQIGESKHKQQGQYGFGELSYEFDTLNLVNFSYNRYHGKSKPPKSTQSVTMENEDHELIYHYKNIGLNRNTYGSTDLNVDYQRSFSVKDRLLTASYRISMSPNDSESNRETQGILNYPNQKVREFSDADMKEHTFQADYTTPIAKIHTLEVGAKYIIRLNESTSGREETDSIGSWISVPSYNDRFKHRQDILSAYGGYSVKVKKVGFKTGLRLEDTRLKVEYPLDQEYDFKADYSNLVPSATISYQLKPMQTFRLGYNMRISRPGIWQLNPYLNTSNPNYHRQGNPELDAVKSNNLNLNYSLFTPKFTMNAGVSYNFVNNSIETITTIKDGISYSTYDNVGKNKSVYASSYINWNPTMKLRIFGNLAVNYRDVKANNNSGLSNHGFIPQLYGGLQYKFPLDFRANLNGGYYGSYVSLQGKGPSYNFYGVSIGKSFQKDRLNLNLYFSNFLSGKMKFTNKETTPTYLFTSTSKQSNQYIGFSVSYRFGEMKEQIKKAKRGISNDDTMNQQGGESGGGGQGQGTPQ